MLARDLRVTLAVSAIAILAIVNVASANAGAAMAMQGIAHLLLGGAVLGLIEALVIRMVWRTPALRTIGLCVIANYVSSWVGVFTMVPITWGLYTGVFGGPLMDTALWVFLAAMVIAFLISWICEWPLVRWTFPTERRSWRTALRASLVAHCASYPLLAWFYAATCSFSLYTDVSRDHTLSFVPRGLDAWVYYIDGATGAVMRVRPNGDSREKIAEPGPDGPSDWLFVVRGADGDFELWRKYDDGNKPVRIMSNFAARAQLTDEFGEDTPPEHVSVSPTRKAVDFRPEDARGWSVEGHWWAEKGLFASHADGRELRVACAIPPWGLEFSSMTPFILPGDLVVYQLGRADAAGVDDSVVILDLNGRRLGRLAAGRSPLVAIGSPVPPAGSD